MAIFLAAKKPCNLVDSEPLIDKSAHISHKKRYLLKPVTHDHQDLPLMTNF